MIDINTENLKIFRNRAEENKKRFLNYRNPINDQTHNDRRPQNEKARETTFLFIGTYDGDLGLRPLPAGMVFWESTDIELYKNGVPVLSNQINQGEAYQVIVTVNNNGDMICPSFNVELFVTDPSVGFNVANATLLDVKKGKVNQHSSKNIKFDLIATGNFVGHRCLFARVFSDGSNEYPLSATALDAVNDRHVAQQNINVIKQGEVVKMQVNHAGELGNDAILQIVQQKTVAPSLTKKLRQFFPDKKLSTQLQDLSFKPTATKRIVGAINTIFTERPQPLKNLNQLNVQALNRGTVLSESLIIPSLRSHQLNNNLVDRVKAASNITADRISYDLNQNLFHVPLERGTYHDVEFTVPDLGLKANEVAAYSIEMRNPTTNTVVGGITLLVTG